jgi:hypothetical protein
MELAAGGAAAVAAGAGRGGGAGAAAAGLGGVTVAAGAAGRAGGGGAEAAAGAGAGAGAGVAAAGAMATGPEPVDPAEGTGAALEGTYAVTAGGAGMSSWAFTAPRVFVLMRRLLTRTEPRRAGAPLAVGLRFVDERLASGPAPRVSSSPSSVSMSAAAATSCCSKSEDTRNQQSRN